MEFFATNWKQYARSARSSGVMGEACEMAARSYTSGRMVKAVKPAGKTDAFFTYADKSGKRHTLAIEYKTACGRIDNIGAADFVAYWPEPVEDIEVQDGFVMFSREEWSDFISGYGGRGSLTIEREDGEVHIQSFRGLMTGARPKASLPLANYIYEVCDGQPTLREFTEYYRRNK